MVAFCHARSAPCRSPPPLPGAIATRSTRWRGSLRGGCRRSSSSNTGVEHLANASRPQCSDSSRAMTTAASRGCAARQALRRPLNGAARWPFGMGGSRNGVIIDRSYAAQSTSVTWVVPVRTADRAFRSTARSPGTLPLRRAAGAASPTTAPRSRLRRLRRAGGRCGPGLSPASRPDGRACRATPLRSRSDRPVAVDEARPQRRRPLGSGSGRSRRRRARSRW